ncbi:MAG: divergent polysaccharide deacetylase family protein [Desulfobacteraceae bacterium]|nr:divergent polysaccharide deacetylase family protein [Desulfobacteraceae bacterium]
MVKKTPSRKKASAKKRAVTSSGTQSVKKAAPRKKAAAKKVSANRIRKRKTGTHANNLMETIATALTTVFFVLFALGVAYVILHSKDDDTPHSKVRTNAVKKAPPGKLPKSEKPEFEIYPEKPVPSERSAATPPVKAAAGVLKIPPPESPRIPDGVLPKVAIIIDDLGYDLSMAKRFIKLGDGLTCAVLPQSVYGRQIAVLAEESGHEVMLHQPMEPNEYPMVDPGPGALLLDMTPDERINRLTANIDSIPGVKGVNNHMGSKFTTLSDEMNQVFTVLKTRGLFFVDSRTTAATVSRSSAQLFHVPFAERDVFLDHVREESQVRAQIAHLINIAEIHGKAVGIGHPHEVTYRMLKEAMPEIKKRVHLVPASAIVELF